MISPLKKSPKVTRSRLVIELIITILRKIILKLMKIKWLLAEYLVGR